MDTENFYSKTHISNKIEFLIKLNKYNMPCVVLVFRRPIMLTDKLVSFCAGNLVHVDMLLIESSCPEKSLTYTSYVGEHFSRSLDAKKQYNEHDNIALKINLSEVEYEKLSVYVNTLADSIIPYNYHDLANIFIPSGIAKYVLSDVESEDPKTLKSLFCSQAVVLALRNSLECKHSVYRALWNVNSRSCSPETLYELVQPITDGVRCAPLQNGIVLDQFSNRQTKKTK